MRAVETLEYPMVTSITPETRKKGSAAERISPFDSGRLRSVLSLLVLAMVSLVKPSLDNEAPRQAIAPWRDFQDSLDGGDQYEIFETEPTPKDSDDVLVLSNTVQNLFASQGPDLYVDEERISRGLGENQFAMLACHQKDTEGNEYETTTLFTSPTAPEEGFGSRGSILTALFDNGAAIPSVSHGPLTTDDERLASLSILPENYREINGFDPENPAEVSLGLFELQPDNSIKLTVQATITVHKRTPLIEPY